MYQWIQKELFFVASLAFIFVATASVGNYIKHRLPRTADAPSAAARVVWPDNTEAIYPETPPETFFQAAATPKPEARPKPETSVKTQSPAPKAQIATRQRPRPVARTGTQTTYARRVYQQRLARQRKASYRVSRYKAKPVTPKTLPVKAAPKAATSTVDTQALRSYDVHMKWVRKTLADYRSAHNTP